MREYSKELATRKFNNNNLINFGFKKDKDTYKYNESIMNNLFRVEVEINENNMRSKLIENEFNEEYLQADNINATGEYAGKIREEYKNVIDNIFDKCTYKEAFKNKQTQEIIKYIKEKYNDELEFLWEMFDDNAVIRNKINNKWYTLFMVVPENKLGLKTDKKQEVLDILYDKDNINNIVDNKNIFPGYHMNKKSWITIILDGRIVTERIYELIDNSYNLSIDKNKEEK